MQMGFAIQGRSLRKGRNQVQGQVSSQRLFLEGRHRLQRGFLTCGLTYLHQGFVDHYSGAGFRARVDGRHDGLPPWGFGGRDIHGAAKGVRRARGRREGLSFADITVWIEAVIKTVVPMI